MYNFKMNIDDKGRVICMSTDQETCNWCPNYHVCEEYPVYIHTDKHSSGFEVINYKDDCDYCKQDTVLENYKSSEGNIKSLEIVFRPEFRNLIVETTTGDGHNFTFGIDNRFNYCPMCGRNLNKRGDDNEL